MFSTNANNEEQMAAESRANRRIRLGRLPRNPELKDFVHSPRRGISAEELERFSDADWLAQCKNLYIQGPGASGKTFLAGALGKAWCRSGRNVLFADALMFAYHLDGVRSLTTYIKRLDLYDALILDDIGKALRSNHGARVLAPLLEHRQDQGPVVATADLFSWSLAVFGTNERKLLELFVENAETIELRNQCQLPRKRSL